MPNDLHELTVAVARASGVKEDEVKKVLDELGIEDVSRLLPKHMQEAMRGCVAFRARTGVYCVPA